MILRVECDADAARAVTLVMEKAADPVKHVTTDRASRKLIENLDMLFGTNQVLLNAPAVVFSDGRNSS